ncbi:Like-Sm ribonucleoprotein core [Staphylothermus hellenicus DSM 12710]|uniref:Like-Sm ribonucleoprotein core n=2 Tax=Staphylothermus hellenicus TaxID=84599 RepID=D7D900_STAHD|nr:Like-Sm ribonucleoprotein core [Staphylothermus hellenicus DSM 12710]
MGITMSVPKPKTATPLKYLKSAINQIVLVKIKDGHEYIGTLDMVDHTMNVVLSNCQEYGDNGKPTARYGKVLIRGSHIVFISINYGQVAPEIAVG